MIASRYFLDGERVSSEFYFSLSREQRESVDVFGETVGGSGEENKKVLPEIITIVLSDQAGEKMKFKVKKDTKFQKVFDAYASRLGVPVDSLPFHFNGECITGENTPRMLEMEDGDEIQVKVLPEIITIVLSDEAGEKMQFKVKKDTKFQKVFDAYASRLGVPVDSLSFRFRREHSEECIKGENTPRMLEIEDEDVIEVIEKIPIITLSEAERKLNKTVIITLFDNAGCMQFKVEKDTKFQEIFDAYASRSGVPLNSFTFHFYGMIIAGEDTPRMLQIDDRINIITVSMK